LSTVRINTPRAGEDGIDAAQRWVGGNAVIVRDKPSPSAAVVSRMALNTSVKLLGQDTGSGYCEIRLLSGQGGFTACRYLELAPVALARIVMEDSPDYDPERAFWLNPSWFGLERYARYLEQRSPISPQGPWPRDEALERMKAHLALGIKERQPEPYADWSDIKQSKMGLAIWASSESVDKNIPLTRALEFASVQPSLFRSEAEIAPPWVSAEDASGRLGIVVRYIVTPRPGSENEGGAGLYDMLAYTQSLARPVKKVRLFRDGRLSVESSFVRSRVVLWKELDPDPPECEG